MRKRKRKQHDPPVDTNIMPLQYSGPYIRTDNKTLDDTLVKLHVWWAKPNKEARR